MLKLKTVKGTKDLLGDEIESHELVKKEFEGICKSFNFDYISTPILEHREVFTKSLGVSSDIVSKEMYHFKDQGDDELVLRPEGTAAVARALVSNSLEQNVNTKFFYHGPMFRRERPQSGRLRQFHQVGLEYFGQFNVASDLEIIILAERFLEKIGIRRKLNLQINSLGNNESLKEYNKAVKKYFEKESDKLSLTSKNRLTKNPLRILDSKDEKDKRLIEGSPDIREFWDIESRQAFEDITSGFDSMGIDYNFNRFLVRGLDYYNHLAFEYVTKENKSQNTVLAGGRYDGLVQSLGGSDITGVGWAAGIERIVMLIEEKANSRERLICFFASNNNLNKEVLQVMNKIEFCNSIKMQMINSGNLKKKFSKANKFNASACVVFGEEEWKSNKLIFKDLVSGSQSLIDLKDIKEFLNKNFGLK